MVILAWAGSGLAPLLAGVPSKQVATRYMNLWSQSPFTIPPKAPDVVVEESNPLEDFTLAGVCKLQKGWFVVLINKKQREERVSIKPDQENSEGFQIVKVEEGGGHMDTRVEIRTRGGKSGWVEYDKKFIAVRTTVPTNPAGRAQPNQPPVPGRPGAQPARPGTPNVRPPVPTPTSNNNSRGPSRVRRVPTPPSR